MYAYDSENDEYNEVFDDDADDDETTDPVRKDQNVFLLERCSFRSSRFSIRSSNFTFFTRIVSKSGRRNTIRSKVPRKYVVYFRDLGNTLLNIRWRWILTTVCLVHFVSFFLFGLLWMGVAYISGDFEEGAKDFCVVNTKTLTGYILLSIETMLTIGYGYRYPTEKCIQGWIVPFLQALVSVGIQGALVTAVYVKISKPFTKNKFGFFSKKAVVCLRDGKLCLIIRIVDLFGKVTVGTNVTMYYVDKDVSTDPFFIQQLKLEPYGFLFFPLEIVHVIDSKSPLWDISPHQLLLKRVEIVVVAEGSSIVTGQISQNRSSYVSSDILWGHRFVSCVEYNEDKEKYIINRKKVNAVIPFDTPLCSARDLKKIEEHLL